MLSTACYRTALSLSDFCCMCALNYCPVLKWCALMQATVALSIQTAQPSSHCVHVTLCITLGLIGSSPLSIPCISSLYSRNTLRQTTKDLPNEFLLSDVLLIRISLLRVYVHYDSKPNRGQKLVCVLSINLP